MITIIDYGAGNIGSVLNMIRHVGGLAEVTGNAAGVLGAKRYCCPAWVVSTTPWPGWLGLAWLSP